MLGHVVLELIDPFALVPTVRTEVLPLFLVDPHVVLEEGKWGLHWEWKAA